MSTGREEEWRREMEEGGWTFLFDSATEREKKEDKEGKKSERVYDEFTPAQ